MPHLKVLVVDESARGRDRLQRFIASCGFDCDTAENRDQATILLASVPFDLVVIGAGITDSAGRPLYHEVVRRAPRTGLVILIPQGHPAPREPAADLVLEEPYNLAALCAQLYRMLKSRLDGPHRPEPHRGLSAEPPRETEGAPFSES